MTDAEQGTLFDTFVIVDWSAAGQPKTGRDSIWICRHGKAGERLLNPPTRHAARETLLEILADAVAGGERVLVGCDFPFGYPAGFAARLGLSGRPWRAVWDEIAGLIEDDAKNRNNRFAVAADLNRRVSRGAFPFWGCPSAAAGPYLAPTHHRLHQAGGLVERRLIDVYVPTTQPCWKLLGTGSVGGQALTGIPVVRALRDDPRWQGRIRVWPFETGLRAPEEGVGVVMAEIYPSLWRIAPQPNEPKDAAQVRDVARFFAARDQAGELAALFDGDPALTAQQRTIIETEEAWTLGVTAPKQSRLALSPSSKHAVPRLLRFARNDSKGVAEDSNGVAAGSCHCEERSDAAISVRSSRSLAKIPAYTYLRDPAAIYRRSFALVRAEADLARFPVSLRPLAVRLAHAAGDVAILADLAWSRGAAEAGRRAMASGAAILVDSTMVAAGIVTARLPAGNEVICTLRNPAVAALAAAQGTTRSAAAVELWRPYLAGAVVAIGNAPTALFRLLEMLAEGADKPALVLGFPVGFVGAAEAKEALSGFGRGLSYVTLRGRRGGSALAAAALNALCGEPRPAASR